MPNDLRGSSIRCRYGFKFRRPFPKRNAALEEKLAKANQVIDIQGKVYALLRACAGESADQLDLPPWNKRSPT